MSFELSDYPTKYESPENAYYLPLSSIRIALSYLCSASDDGGDVLDLAKAKYKPTDLITKEVALNIIHKWAEAINLSLSGFNNIWRQKLRLETHGKHCLENEVINLTQNINSFTEFQLFDNALQKASLDWDSKVHAFFVELEKRCDFTYSSDDLRVAGLDLKETLQPDCYAYAFYQLNEEKSIPYIFNKRWPEEYFTHPVSFLKKWGYNQVKEPVSGDLAIYCSQIKTPLTTRHAGIFTQDGRIISKWGSGSVYKHDLNSVNISYGNCVYFFRKEIRFTFSSLLWDEQQNALKSLENFSHPATQSPLSTIGCGNWFYKHAAAINCQSFLKSLYSHTDNQVLKIDIMKHIDKHIKSDAKSKAEVIQQIGESILSLDRKFADKIAIV
jgi:hypothetical protein